MGACRPKENNEWLLFEEVESMGFAWEGRGFLGSCLVGLGISLLLFLKQESPSLSVTGAMRAGYGIWGRVGGGDMERAAAGLAWGWHDLVRWCAGKAGGFAGTVLWSGGEVK